MKTFYNIKTKEDSDNLPSITEMVKTPVTPEQKELDPDLPDYIDVPVTRSQTIQEASVDGWRQVVPGDVAPDGYRVVSTDVVDIDSLTCKVVITKTVNTALAKHYCHFPDKTQYDNLPSQIGSTWNPTLAQCAPFGWRDITDAEEPQEGNIVITQDVIDNDDGLTCRVVITKQETPDEQQAEIDAANQAVQDAAVQAAQDAIDNQSQDPLVNSLLNAVANLMVNAGMSDNTDNAVAQITASAKTTAVAVVIKQNPIGPIGPVNPVNPLPIKH
jgi:hypothetical protein